MGRSSGSRGGGGGGGSSTSDDTSPSDEKDQTSIDDHGRGHDDKKHDNKGGENDDDDDGTTAAGIGGAIGAGAGAAADAGAGAGAAEAVTPDPETDGDGDSEKDEEEDEELEGDPRGDFERPSEEPSERDTDDSQEREPDRDHDRQEREDVERRDDDKDHDEEGERDDEREEDEEESEATVIVRTDPWDNVGWGLRPVIQKIRERYGDQVEVEYQMVPVRTFDDAEHFREKWERDTERHLMPVRSSIWSEDPPESTEKSNKAFQIAKELNSDGCEKYLHKLWLNSVVKGRNIEDEELLVELASEVGYDADAFRGMWDDVEPERGSITALPETEIDIKNSSSATQEGYFDFEDIEMMFLGFDKYPLPSVIECVERYQPVAITEVEILCELSHSEAVKELRGEERIEKVRLNKGIFWIAEPN
jgi:hypothetical protein